MIHSAREFWSLIHAKVDGIIETRSDSILNGIPANLERYREEVGYLRGLREVMAFGDDLFREPDEQQKEGE